MRNDEHNMMFNQGTVDLLFFGRAVYKCDNNGKAVHRLTQHQIDELFSSKTTGFIETPVILKYEDMARTFRKRHDWSGLIEFLLGIVIFGLFGACLGLMYLWIY